jgi:hypothetical protein
VHPGGFALQAGEASESSAVAGILHY